MTEHTNAFEEQEPTPPVLPKNPEIERMEIQIARLKDLGLHRTAEISQRKLDRLLREEGETLEG